jgi:enamine deaminase RidA (YjgF/YER057c/UK114 family)
MIFSPNRSHFGGSCAEDTAWRGLQHGHAIFRPEVHIMSRRLISTGSPFEKTAGYSRAVIDGDFAFVSGTTGYDYTTMTMPADVTNQTRNCFKTIESALKDGGFAMADIVRATYYITQAKDADALFAVCGEKLGDIRPAATLLVVAGLYKPEMKVEIEVTAKRRTA